MKSTCVAQQHSRLYGWFPDASGRRLRLARVSDRVARLHLFAHATTFTRRLNVNGMNRVFILGRLGATPELQETKAGESYCRLRLATNRTRDVVDWHSVFAFGKLAETCAKHLHKGANLLVEGRLSYWQSPDSQTRILSQSIKADDVQFVTSGRSAESAPNPENLDISGGPRNPDSVAHLA